MDNSQTSSHHYAALLQTVSELRSDLEKTTSKIKVLEEQNFHLSSNYAVVKDELIETRRKYNDAKESYLGAVNEKFDMERRHEQFVDRLKIQLAEKTREFEAIRDKLVPHDIDQLRIKVQEELEIQHKQELKVLESEVEAQRDKFFLLKRDFEKQKAEYHALIQNQQQEIFSLRAEKEAIDESFRRDLSTVLSVEPTPTIRDDKIRAQASKASELGHLIEKLREEAVGLRKEKDQAVYSLEEYKAKHDQSINSLKTKNALLESERAGYQERISRLELDSEKKEVQIRNLKMNIEELTDQIDQSLKMQQELQKQTATLRSDHHNEIEVLKDNHHEEVKELNDEISALSMKVTEREDMIRRFQRETSEIQLRCENNEAEMRRGHNSQLQDLRKKYTSIELELVESKQNARLLDEQISLLQEQNMLERDSLTSEVARIKREKEFLHAKIRELDNTIENQRKKMLSLQHEYLSKAAALEKRVRDNSATITNLEIRNESLLSKNNELEKDKLAVTDNYHRSEQENNELMKRIETLKKDFQTQLEALSPTFKERVNELNQKWKAVVSKEKKRADAYKAKALEAHNKVKTLIESSSGKEY